MQSLFSCFSCNPPSSNNAKWHVPTNQSHFLVRQQRKVQTSWYSEPKELLEFRCESWLSSAHSGHNLTAPKSADKRCRWVLYLLVKVNDIKLYQWPMYHATRAKPQDCTSCWFNQIWDILLLYLVPHSGSRTGKMGSPRSPVTFLLCWANNSFLVKHEPVNL